MAFNVKPISKQQPLIVNVALLGFGFENIITAGKNDDKIFKHDFIFLY